MFKISRTRKRPFSKTWVKTYIGGKNDYWGFFDSLAVVILIRGLGGI